MYPENDLVNAVVHLYKERRWQEIVERYHDHPERNKLLWVFPSQENLNFLRQCLEELACRKILSIGCGSGLLEWILTEALRLPVSGIEVDGAWWHCKYAPPTFIPLLLTAADLQKNIIDILQDGSDTALLFCYFNNRQAFNEYTKYFLGSVMVIIGPGGDKAVHTDPRPFGDVDGQWTLYKWQEVRDSKDFIAVYQNSPMSKT